MDSTAPCKCLLQHADDARLLLSEDCSSQSSPCMWSTDHAHCTQIWDCCFSFGEGKIESFEPRRERLSEAMLAILPPFLGGDVRDWQKGDESETMVHNMVSTSVVHGNRMPINLSQLATLLPCSTYDRKRFAAITIRIDHPRCTALLFTSGKLVITGVKSWYECLLGSLCKIIFF